MCQNDFERKEFSRKRVLQELLCFFPISAVTLHNFCLVKLKNDGLICFSILGTKLSFSAAGSDRESLNNHKDQYSLAARMPRNTGV